MCIKTGAMHSAYNKSLKTEKYCSLIRIFYYGKIFIEQETAKEKRQRKELQSHAHLQALKKESSQFKNIFMVTLF